MLLWLTVKNMTVLVCFPIYESVCVLCVTVLVNCLLNVFAICVGEVIVFSLKVGVFLCVVLFFRWLVHVLSSKEYVYFVCDPSVCLGVPSICQIYVFA